MTRQHTIAILARRADAAAAAGDRVGAWAAWQETRALVHAALMDARLGQPADADERRALGQALVEAGSLYGAEEWVRAGRALGAQ